MNPVEGIEKGLAKQRDKQQHHAALAWTELPALMRRIEAVEGLGALALRFAVLTASRSGEVRGAEWSEFDLDGAVWTIPASRMKAGAKHRVPLSKPVLAILKEVQGLSGVLVFPSKKAGKPLSDMTLAAVLKRLGVAVTVHGFRSTFRDWAEESTSYTHEVKEAALAHTVKNKVEAAYRRSDLFDRRRALMDDWAKYLALAATTARAHP
jgi:integrase